jgi:spore coat protein CotF
MAGQLTQKERMMLQDQVKHEELCIQKYTGYAGQASDPAVTRMFNENAQDERDHYSTLNQFLGKADAGVQAGATGGVSTRGAGQATQAGQMSQPGQGSFTGQPRQAGPASQSGGFPANDSQMLTDMLTTEKFISGSYDTAIFEASDPQVRQAFQHIQGDEQKHGEKIFRYMQDHGMYQTQG